MIIYKVKYEYALIYQADKFKLGILKQALKIIEFGILPSAEHECFNMFRFKGDCNVNAK